MSERRTDYTLLVFKFDRRRKTGYSKVGSYDYSDQTNEWMWAEIKDLQFRLYPENKYCFELHETYVERTNLMTGEKYKERFDTPMCCSPSSETYWSM